MIVGIRHILGPKVVFPRTPIAHLQQLSLRHSLALLFTALLTLPMLSWAQDVATIIHDEVATPLTSGMVATPDKTPAKDLWLVIDTEKLNLSVMQGDKAVKVFENIAIGSNGPTLNKQRNDDKTPLGEFKITQIRPSDRFKLFMALSYPNREHTERAYQEHRIDAAEYKALRYDLDHGRPPSQNTSLGGQLGIHGLGRGDLKIHETVNWTRGCIAMTNEQVQELTEFVAVGTRVVVR